MTPPPPYDQVEPDQVTRDLSQVTGQPDAVRDQVQVCSDPYEAASGAHALVICTEWDVFQVSSTTGGLIDVQLAFFSLKLVRQLGIRWRVF